MQFLSKSYSLGNSTICGLSVYDPRREIQDTTGWLLQELCFATILLKGMSTIPGQVSNMVVAISPLKEAKDPCISRDRRYSGSINLPLKICIRFSTHENVHLTNHSSAIVLFLGATILIKFGFFPVQFPRWLPNHQRYPLPRMSCDYCNSPWMLYNWAVLYHSKKETNKCLAGYFICKVFSH